MAAKWINVKLLVNGKVIHWAKNIRKLIMSAWSQGVNKNRYVLF